MVATNGRVLIFGREPAVWVGIIEAVLAFLLSWNMLGLTVDQIGGIMAVVTAVAGLVTAYYTVETWLSALIGVAKALFICLATFQINLTENQTTTAIVLITVVFGLVNRDRTQPSAAPSFRAASPPPLPVAA